jgi:hypothetical protein
VFSRRLLLLPEGGRGKLFQDAQIKNARTIATPATLSARSLLERRRQQLAHEEIIQDVVLVLLS